MNDIVFAGGADKLKAVGEKKLLRCVKVVAKKNGDYTVIPQGVQLNFTPAEEDVAVCIEQPLTPPLNGICRGTDPKRGMRIALKLAAQYADGQHAAALSALGELIIGFICDDIVKAPHPVIAALKGEIEESFTDCTYSVESSIAKLPLNYDYVRKLYKKQTGITPHEYLTSLRMERAKAILVSGVTNRYSNYTVSQIAEACGFAEPLYFSRVFKKYFGVAPSRYVKGGANITENDK